MDKVYLSLSKMTKKCCRIHLYISLVSLQQVSVLLNGMLDHSFRERSMRKSQGSRLVEWILQRWELLRPWWGNNASTSESKTATLTLLSKVLQVQHSQIYMLLFIFLNMFSLYFCTQVLACV